MARSLIVLPDDSARPIVKAIDEAKRSLRVKMFTFSHPKLLNSVIAARRRGVKVQVMLNPERRDGDRDNDHTRKVLERRRVDVKNANPAFDLTHEKSMVVDDETAFVQSCNWVERNLNETRDYAVVTTSKHDVADVIDGFDADWHRQAFTPRHETHLVWCPGARDRICRFIDAAKHRLWVQNERYQDMVVIERLVRAAQRGVKVAVMARPPHTLKREKLVEGVGGLRILDDVGIKVRKIKPLRLHGKMILADGVAAIVGSINLAPGSFDSRRELAIEIRDDDVVDRLASVVHDDWRHSRPLDLSDEGLLADLEDRVEDTRQLLALDGSRPRKRKPEA
jgi:phosphatidylserine/phosphatidylglycerophosphate/cardiolipin synthase-like enzyme